MRFKTIQQLPEKHVCRKCTKEKPISEMIVIRERRTGDILLRARCKECNNKQERGHRREYKTKYLKSWRKNNPEVNESYWRQSTADNRVLINARAYERFQRHHEAILIQGRLSRRGIKVSIAGAKGLYKKYGRCYPTRFGLTPAGLRECERIRSSQRRAEDSKRFSSLEIRMMVYEDGFYITPRRQPVPYKAAAQRLRSFQAQRHKALEAAA
ncbi:MAG TPA: hypothetical protein VHA06_07000 [Candidatus Angelobacter sp.]|jgi:hypothetical protein|nr:hypothetical protein [Candidatus Angelobacter sp.]